MIIKIIMVNKNQMPHNFIILPSGASAWFGKDKRYFTKKFSNHWLIGFMIAFLEHKKRLQLNLVSRFFYD